MTTAVNKRIRDAQVRHHIGVQRVAAGTSKRSSEVFAALRARLHNYAALNVDALASPSKSSMSMIREHIRVMVHEAYAEIEALLRKDLEDFSDYETQFQTGVLSKATGVQFNQPELGTPLGGVRLGARKKPHGDFKKSEGSTLHEIIAGHEAQTCKRLIRWTLKNAASLKR